MAWLALTLATPDLAMASSRSATLEAIHQLENPRNLTRTGPAGELGAYQFRPATWRMHTKVRFEFARVRSISDVVAVRHYEWLERGLKAAQVPVTPYMIALAWNAGLSAALAGRAPPAARDYADRAANLVAEFHRIRALELSSVHERCGYQSDRPAAFRPPNAPRQEVMKQAAAGSVSTRDVPVAFIISATGTSQPQSNRTQPNLPEISLPR